MRASIVNEASAEEETPTIKASKKDDAVSDYTGKFNAESIEIKVKQSQQMVGGPGETNEEGFLKYPTFNKKNSKPYNIDYTNIKLQ